MICKNHRGAAHKIPKNLKISRRLPFEYLNSLQTVAVAALKKAKKRLQFHNAVLQ